MFRLLCRPIPVLCSPPVGDEALAKYPGCRHEYSTTWYVVPGTSGPTPVYHTRRQTHGHAPLCSALPCPALRFLPPSNSLRRKDRAEVKVQTSLTSTSYQDEPDSVYQGGVCERPFTSVAMIPFAFPRAASHAAAPAICAQPRVRHARFSPQGF